jgi:FkbM family methyltransferase
MLRTIARELLPPVVTNSIRRLRDRHGAAEAKELKRIRETLGPTVTTILGWPFHINEGRDFVGLYQAYFRDQVYRFSACPDRPLIIDCGAHIGVSVACWKTLYPHARVVAFEADPINFDLLQRNCGHLKDVELVRAAVWDREGLVLFAAKGGEMGHLADFAHADSGVVKRVPAVRLGKFLDGHVDLLKMDIEGAEIDVLKDCAGQLDDVDRIFLEYHSFIGRDQMLAQTIGILEAAGFRLHSHVGLPSPRPFDELLVFNEKDLRLEIFAYRQGASVKPALKYLR